MPVFLKNANSLDTFACDCCGKVFPRISMHEHHKIKKASGGQDTRDNIAILDAHCHHALHQIEAAVKNDKKRLLVPDLLKKLYPDNSKAREFCLYLAMTAAVGSDSKNADNKPAQGIDYSQFDSEELVHLTPPAVPPYIRDLVNRVVREMRTPKGRSLGVGRYLRFLIEADLKKRGYKLQSGKS
jgi:hypothetical protein